MRRKSRVEAATLGSEVEVASVGWVVVAMAFGVSFVPCSFQVFLDGSMARDGVACWYKSSGTETRWMWS